MQCKIKCCMAWLRDFIAVLHDQKQQGWEIVSPTSVSTATSALQQSNRQDNQDVLPWSNLIDRGYSSSMHDQLNCKETDAFKGVHHTRCCLICYLSLTLKFLRLSWQVYVFEYSVQKYDWSYKKYKYCFKSTGFQNQTRNKRDHLSPFPPQNYFQSDNVYVLQSLKVLKTAEFLPFIVFIAAPSVEALKVMYEEGRRFARGNRVSLSLSALVLILFISIH